MSVLCLLITNEIIGVTALSIILPAVCAFTIYRELNEVGKSKNQIIYELLVKNMII